MVPTSPSDSEVDGLSSQNDRQPTPSNTRVPTPAPVADGIPSARSSLIRGGRADRAPLSGALSDAAAHGEIASSGNGISAKASHSPLGLGVDGPGGFDTLEDLVLRGALPASSSPAPTPTFPALSPVPESVGRQAAITSLADASVDSHAETLPRELLVEPVSDASSQNSSSAGDVSSEPLLTAVPTNAPATPALSIRQPTDDPMYTRLLSALESITTQLETDRAATVSALLEMQQRLVVFGAVTRGNFGVLAADLDEMKPIVRAQAGSFLRFGRQLTSLADTQSVFDSQLTQHTSLLLDLVERRPVQSSTDALGEVQAGVASVQQGLAEYMEGMQNVRNEEERARRFAAASVALRSSGSRGPSADVPVDRSDTSAGDLGADMGLDPPLPSYDPSAPLPPSGWSRSQGADGAHFSRGSFGGYPGVHESERRAPQFGASSGAPPPFSQSGDRQVHGFFRTHPPELNNQGTPVELAEYLDHRHAVLPYESAVGEDGLYGLLCKVVYNIAVRYHDYKRAVPSSTRFTTQAPHEVFVNNRANESVSQYGDIDSQLVLLRQKIKNADILLFESLSFAGFSQHYLDCVVKGMGFIPLTTFVQWVNNLADSWTSFFSGCGTWAGIYHSLLLECKSHNKRNGDFRSAIHEALAVIRTRSNKNQAVNIDDLLLKLKRGLPFEPNLVHHKHYERFLLSVVERMRDRVGRGTDMDTRIMEIATPAWYSHKIIDSIYLGDGYLTSTWAAYRKMIARLLDGINRARIFAQEGVDSIESQNCQRLLDREGLLAELNVQLKSLESRLRDPLPVPDFLGLAQAAITHSDMSVNCVQSSPAAASAAAGVHHVSYASDDDDDDDDEIVSPSPNTPLNALEKPRISNDRPPRCNTCGSAGHRKKDCLLSKHIEATVGRVDAPYGVHSSKPFPYYGENGEKRMTSYVDDEGKTQEKQMRFYPCACCGKTEQRNGLTYSHYPRDCLATSTLIPGLATGPGRQRNDTGRVTFTRPDGQSVQLNIIDGLSSAGESLAVPDGDDGDSSPIGVDHVQPDVPVSSALVSGAVQHSLDVPRSGSGGVDSLVPPVLSIAPNGDYFFADSDGGEPLIDTPPDPSVGSLVIDSLFIEYDTDDEMPSLMYDYDSDDDSDVGVDEPAVPSPKPTVATGGSTMGERAYAISLRSVSLGGSTMVGSALAMDERQQTNDWVDGPAVPPPTARENGVTPNVAGETPTSDEVCMLSLTAGQDSFASGDPSDIAESKHSSVDGNSVASARNVSSDTSVDSCLDVYGPFTEDSFDPDEALPSDFTTPLESLKARLNANPSHQEAAALTDSVDAEMAANRAVRELNLTCNTSAAADVAKSCLDVSLGGYTDVGILAAQIERLKELGVVERGGIEFQSLYQPTDCSSNQPCHAEGCDATATLYCTECGKAFCRAHCYHRPVGSVGRYSVRCDQCFDLLDPPPDFYDPDGANIADIVVEELTPEFLYRRCPCIRHSSAVLIQALRRRFLIRVKVCELVARKAVRKVDTDAQSLTSHQLAELTWLFRQTGYPLRECFMAILGCSPQRYSISPSLVRLLPDTFFRLPKCRILWTSWFCAEPIWTNECWLSPPEQDRAWPNFWIRHPVDSTLAHGLPVASPPTEGVPTGWGRADCETGWSAAERVDINKYALEADTLVVVTTQIGESADTDDESKDTNHDELLSSESDDSIIPPLLVVSPDGSAELLLADDALLSAAASAAADVAASVIVSVPSTSTTPLGNSRAPSDVELSNSKAFSSNVEGDGPNSVPMNMVVGMDVEGNSSVPMKLVAAPKQSQRDSVQKFMYDSLPTNDAFGNLTFMFNSEDCSWGGPNRHTGFQFPLHQAKDGQKLFQVPPPEKGALLSLQYGVTKVEKLFLKLKGRGMLTRITRERDSAHFDQGEVCHKLTGRVLNGKLMLNQDLYLPIRDENHAISIGNIQTLMLHLNKICHVLLGNSLFNVSRFSLRSQEVGNTPLHNDPSNIANSGLIFAMGAAKASGLFNICVAERNARGEIVNTGVEWFGDPHWLYGLHALAFDPKSFHQSYFQPSSLRITFWGQRSDIREPTRPFVSPGPSSIPCWLPEWRGRDSSIRGDIALSSHCIQRFPPEKPADVEAHAMALVAGAAATAAAAPAAAPAAAAAARAAEHENDGAESDSSVLSCLAEIGASVETVGPGRNSVSPASSASEASNVYNVGTEVTERVAQSPEVIDLRSDDDEPVPTFGETMPKPDPNANAERFRRRKVEVLDDESVLAGGHVTHKVTDSRPRSAMDAVVNFRAVADSVKRSRTELSAVDGNSVASAKNSLSDMPVSHRRNKQTPIRGSAKLYEHDRQQQQSDERALLLSEIPITAGPVVDRPSDTTHGGNATGRNPFKGFHAPGRNFNGATSGMKATVVVRRKPGRNCKSNNGFYGDSSDESSDDERSQVKMRWTDCDGNAFKTDGNGVPLATDVDADGMKVSMQFPTGLAPGKPSVVTLHLSRVEADEVPAGTSVDRPAAWSEGHLNVDNIHVEHSRNLRDARQREATALQKKADALAVVRSTRAALDAFKETPAGKRFLRTRVIPNFNARLDDSLQQYEQTSGSSARPAGKPVVVYSRLEQESVTTVDAGTENHDADSELAVDEADFNSGRLWWQATPPDSSPLPGEFWTFKVPSAAECELGLYAVMTLNCTIVNVSSTTASRYFLVSFEICTKDFTTPEAYQAQYLQGADDRRGMRCADILRSARSSEFIQRAHLPLEFLHSLQTATWPLFATHEWIKTFFHLAKFDAG